MNKIIGLVGFIGSGKGTVGDYLHHYYGFGRISFAGTLKDAIAPIFGWERRLLEGDTAESREWRESVDEWWSSKLERTVTPRWVLQYIGTDLFRNHFNSQIWVLSLQKKLENSIGPIVITDVRFPNEIEILENVGGKIWWIRRNPEPVWIDVAINNPDAMKPMTGVHASEYEWVGKGDYTTVWNDGTLNDLHTKVDECLKTYA
jgi:hypothetical protein